MRKVLIGREVAEGTKTGNGCGTCFAFRCHLKSFSLYVVLTPKGVIIEGGIFMKNPLSYFSNEMRKFRKLIVLALMGLFIALGIVFTRVLKPIDLPYLRVSFGFIATSVCSMMLGPFLGGINAAVADVAGFFLFPTPNAFFFPGLTFSALLAGVIYGLYLYKKPVTLLRVALAVLTVTIFIDMLLNTYWLSILLGQAWKVMFPIRALKAAVWYPVQVLIIYYLRRIITSKYQDI